MYYVLLGIFAYGPLEMFFVFWLVRNTEAAIGKQKKGAALLSLAGTAILYGFAHFIFQGYGAWLGVGKTFFVLGLIGLQTRNLIGPMIGWTILNMQVWSFASMLWTK